MVVSLPVRFCYPSCRSLVSVCLPTLKFHQVDAGERAARFSLCLPQGLTTFLANLPNPARFSGASAALVPSVDGDAGWTEGDRKRDSHAPG